tara:strand:+ start:161 stop:505 length:345 start_codon:yes stop_codon:yes gene_type:complete
MKRITVTFEIDHADWTSGHDDMYKCVDHLETWFMGLSLKSQLSIYYAQRCAFDMAERARFKFGEAFDPWNDDCPVLEQVFKAQDRAIKRFAPWKPDTGFNMELFTTGVELEDEA